MQVFELIVTPVYYLLQVLWMALLVNVLLSWVPGARGSTFGMALDRFLSPVLAPVRNIFRKYTQGSAFPIDISPLVLFLVIRILMQLLRPYTIF